MNSAASAPAAGQLKKALGPIDDRRRLAQINEPLPQAMKAAAGAGRGWRHMRVWVGLFGRVAPFHGINMGCPRQIFALARAGCLMTAEQRAASAPDAMLSTAAP